MKQVLMIIVLIITSRSLAKEDWLCTQESSLMEDSNILACGVASGKDENEARSKAFDNAKLEFDKLCAISNRCNRKQVNVVPKRTTCDRTLMGYKCYRLLVFNIQDKAHTRAPVAIEKIVNDEFTPFVYQENENPRLHKGMTKQQLLFTFGAPESVTRGSYYEPDEFKYSNDKFCDYSYCRVYLVDGKVNSWHGVKLKYTDDLK